MKRFLIFIILLIPFICSASIQNQHFKIIQQYNAAGGGGGGSDCDWSSADIAWNGEHTSGNTYWCKADDSSVNGTLSGASIVTDPGTLTGTFVLIDADADYFDVATTSSEYDMTQGFIGIKVVTTNLTGTTYLSRLDEPVGSDYEGYWINSSEIIDFRIYNSITEAVQSTDAITITGETIDATDYGITYIYRAWDLNGSLHGQAAGVELGLCLDTDGTTCLANTGDTDFWDYDADADNPSDISDVDYFRIGYDNSGSHSQDVYITNVEVYNTTTP